MTARPRLVVVTAEPTPQQADLPPMQYLDPEWAKALDSIRAKLSQATRPFAGHAAPKAALTQAKAELYALATEIQRLARRLPS